MEKKDNLIIVLGAQGVRYNDIHKLFERKNEFYRFI